MRAIKRNVAGSFQPDGEESPTDIVRSAQIRHDQLPIIDLSDAKRSAGNVEWRCRRQIDPRRNGLRRRPQRLLRRRRNAARAQQPNQFVARAGRFQLDAANPARRLGATSRRPFAARSLTRPCALRNRLARSRPANSRRRNDRVPDERQKQQRAQHVRPRESPEAANPEPPRFIPDLPAVRQKRVRKVLELRPLFGIKRNRDHIKPARSVR
jgi:hypothetical protein